MRLWGGHELYYGRQRARDTGFWVLHGNGHASDPALYLAHSSGRSCASLRLTYFSDVPGEHAEYTQTSLEGGWEL